MRLALLAAALIYATPVLAADVESPTDKPDCKVADATPSSKKTFTWSGSCKEGYADGAGTLAGIVDGKQVTTFEGSLVRGRMHGEAYLQLEDGTQYEGGLRNGKWHGKGTLVTISRTRYDGEWSDGKEHGAGAKSYSTGGRYEGQWKDGKFHGKGKASYIGGQVFEGEFQEGKPLGQPAPASVAASREHRLKSDSAEGGKFRHTLASGGPAPFNKSYAQMSEQERQGVHRLYPMLHPDDEPPYPARGTAALVAMVSEANYELRVKGLLFANVLVDASGVPTSVQVFKSPSPAMTAVMTILLLKEKFKPALCSGAPCPMAFPFHAQFEES